MTRVLLDENLPRKLKGSFLPSFEVVTVSERGWAGMKNGALLKAAADEFDIFVSMDAGIAYQQNIVGLPIGVILLSAASNQLGNLLPLMPQINEALTCLQRGDFLIIKERG